MTAVYTELQPVFNKIWQEFVVDKRSRAATAFGCVYRGGSDAASEIRCAIGVCIPDDMYDSELDHHGSIADIHDEMPEWYKSVFNGVKKTQLLKLQFIHDSHFKDFEGEMRAFADDHNLTIPD